MKILHIAPVFSGYADGPSRSILGLAKGQALWEHGVALLPSEPPGLSPELIPHSVRLLPGPKRRHLNPFWISKSWIELIKTEIGSPEIVHFHDFYIPFQFALARLCKKEGWCYISSPRGSLMHLAQRQKFLKKNTANFLFAKRFLNEATAIHALCENEARAIRKFVPDSNIFKFPNGIEDSLFSLIERIRPDDLSSFANSSHLVLVYIGRIDVFTKGLDLLLLSLKKLQTEGLGKKIRLIIIGPFHTVKDRHEVNAIIKSLKFPKGVMIAGPLYGEDKWRLLKASDVFILTSRHEGMPNSVLEAMAFGKPCLVTPGTNMQEILSICNGGWLPNGSVDSIAKTIVEIEKTRGAIFKRGTNAQNYIKNNLTWSIIARQSIEKLRIILHSS